MKRVFKTLFVFALLLFSLLLFGCKTNDKITEEDLVRADEEIYSQAKHLLETGYTELESPKKNRFPYETALFKAYKSYSQFYSEYFDNAVSIGVVADTVKVVSRTFVYGGDDEGAVRILTLTALKICDVFEDQEGNLKAGDIIVVCEPGAYIEEDYEEAGYLTIPIEDGRSLSFLKKNSTNTFALRDASIELSDAWHCMSISYETEAATNIGIISPVIKEAISKFND